MDEENAYEESAALSTSQSLYTSAVLSIKRGILLKKGMGHIFRPWSLRTILVDSENRFSYFDREVLKGVSFIE
jgi:hypothetical protein